VKEETKLDLSLRITIFFPVDSAKRERSRGVKGTGRGGSSAEKRGDLLSTRKNLISFVSGAKENEK